MNSTLRFGLILLAVVILILGVLEATQEKPVDWTETYSQKDRNPYGTYVLHEELEQLSSKVEDINQPIYTFLDDYSMDDNSAIVYVNDHFYLGEAENAKLINFVRKGGSLFISSQRFDDDFIDSLGISISDIYTYTTDYKLDEKTLGVELIKGNRKAHLDKFNQLKVFDSLNKNSSQILGYLNINKTLKAPNFIKNKVGKGEVFIHLDPYLFTNYYLLRKDSYNYSFQALDYLNGKNIYWYNKYHSEREESTPLRYILSQKSLATVWYVLFSSLIFYLLFKSKREQKAVAIVEKEPNLSVDFAKSIATLYYENGDPENMIEKKIEYFYYVLRKQLHLDTNDPNLINSLALKTNIPIEETTKLMDEIEAYKNKRNCNIADLKYINSIIEEFKIKANLI